MKKQSVKTRLWLMGLVPTAMALPTMPPPVENYCAFICKIFRFSQWMYGILMALSVVFILYAAFLYLISQGSDERISTAKKVLIYAIVALVVAVLAASVPRLVLKWGGGQNAATGGTACLLSDCP